MSFRIPYVPPPDQTPEEISASQAALQALHDTAKREAAKMKLARERCLAEMAADVEAERIERERIANLPEPEQTSYPLNGLLIKNGVVQSKPTPQPSIAISRTAGFTEMNQQALSKRSKQ